MIKKQIQGIHPNLNLSDFLVSEQKIINSFLSKEWLITRSGNQKFGKGYYRYIIAKPPKVAISVLTVPPISVY